MIAHDECLFVQGEQLLSSTIYHMLPFVSDSCHFFNPYGPAETTVVATRYEVHRDELATIKAIPIGRPLDGYRVYLLDEYRQCVVPGQQGEIVIGGESVETGKVASVLGVV